ncbi:MAG: hypothetical protein SVU69_10365 [Pseudomonadota bacterium]|nr:hypothetical protein [Pseudomonadota bacterium]
MISHKGLKHLAVAAFASTAVMMTGTAIGANQGSVGATSTGDLTITAAVPQRAKISYLDDIDLTTALSSWDGVNPVSGSDDLCVWSNSGGYNVTAAGNGTSNAFELSDGTNAIPYSVQWNDVSGSDAGAQAMTSGSALASQTGASSGATCSSGASLTARVIVTLGNSDLETAASGTYAGVLTLTVAPE